MVVKIGPDENNLVISFGGGLHTRASTDDIDPREAADGSNFLLDLQNRDLRPRPPFDLIGTVPNGLEVRGGGSLLKSDGTISTLFQAAGAVYEWDGITTFTSVGSVNSTSKLRGHWRKHNWQLDDELLLTDLNLADTVKKWDGTTFASVTFTNEAYRALDLIPCGSPRHPNYVANNHERRKQRVRVRVKREHHSNRNEPLRCISKQRPCAVVSGDNYRLEHGLEFFG